MFRILSNKEIGPHIYRMEIEAGFIAKKAMPGQFIILRIDEKGERIPLTIAETDKEARIVIVYQVVGATTFRLAEKKEGENLKDVVGPLGHATEISTIGHVCCIGGGVGIAEVFPVAKGFKSAGNKLTVIIGARNKELLIYREQLEGIADNFYTVTDDGSYGEKGFVSDVLSRLINMGEVIDIVYAVGPAVMMKVVSDITRPAAIRTIVSLNTILVDGTGMCGSCRIEVGGETRFVCVDGPEFDGRSVNFKELISRQGLFKEQEAHVCKIRGIRMGKRQGGGAV